MLNLQWEGSNETFFHDIRSSKFIYPPGYFKFTQFSKEADQQGEINAKSAEKCETIENITGDECKADESTSTCKYVLEPPKGVSLSPADVKSIINRYEKYACIHLDYRKPLSLYTLGGCSSIYFRKGVILEISLSSDPSKHWFAQVVKNVAGRLLLRWCLPGGNIEPSNQQKQNQCDSMDEKNSVEVTPENVTETPGKVTDLAATDAGSSEPTAADVSSLEPATSFEPPASEPMLVDTAPQIEAKNVEADNKVNPKTDENVSAEDGLANQCDRKDNSASCSDESVLIDSVEKADNHSGGSTDEQGKVTPHNDSKLEECIVDEDEPKLSATNEKDDIKEGDFWLFYCHPRVFKVGAAFNRNNYSDWPLSYEPPVALEDWKEYADQFIPSKSDLDDNYTDINYSILNSDEASLLNYMLSRVKLLRPDLLEDWSKLQINDTVLIFPSNLLKLIPVQVDSKIAKVGVRFKSNPLNSNAIDFWYPFDDGNCVLPHSWAEENEIPIDLGCVNSTTDEATEAETCNTPVNDRNESVIDLDAWAASSKSKIGSIRLKNNSDRINEFESNGKVEIVHPDDPHVICEGIIIRVTPPLIWVQISRERIRILPFNSTEIFPSSWTENNGYILTRLLPCNGDNSENNDEQDQVNQQMSCPDSPRQGLKDDASQEIASSFIDHPLSEITSKAWCPRIYFNYKCFTGPSLSKSKLCNLPRFVGPGPVLLVMQEVVSKILSIAYVSSRILNELASDTFIKLLRARKISKIEPVCFKAKYNNNSSKTLRLEVPVIRTTDKVEEYCHLLCSHLKCCFNLFGPKLYDGDNCPSNCRGLTKSNKVLKRTDFFRQQAAAAKKVAEAAADGDEITLPKFVVNLPTVSNKKSNVKSSKRTLDEDDITGSASKKKSKSNKKQKVSQPVEKKEDDEDGDEDDAKSIASSEKGDNANEEVQESAVGGRLSRHKKPNRPVDDEVVDTDIVDKENGHPTGERKSNSLHKTKGSQVPSRKLQPHENPINWSIARVHKFLCDSQCSTFASIFRDHVSTFLLGHI